jgi:hypothetical protein
MDLMSDYDRVTGAEFDLYCSAIVDDDDNPMFLANPDQKDRIKREWMTGRCNNILNMEIEIPDNCPLPKKEDVIL